MLDQETRKRTRQTTPRRVDPAARRNHASEALPIQSLVGNAATVQLLTGGSQPNRREPERLRTGVRQRDRDGERGRQTEREQERDRRDRRPEGGRASENRDGLESHVQSDWAGRAILARYLAGEGDWDIRDDPAWSAYMMRSQVLRGQLRPRVHDIARQLGAEHHVGMSPVADQFHAEVENGEGIVGYQYLHGSNRDVGDFAITGIAVVTAVYGQSDPTAIHTTQPGTTVHMRLRFTWNDMIDPNPQYGTDTVKSWFARIITLGQAAAYRISISWEEECMVVIPDGGSPVMSGYPEH